ncbi:MAG: hypothetical protein FJ139_03100 [Deltaproteobacteria bacterium]|nr:hypothetical protein [Deltaproteobacteria bacterium]
MNNRLPGIVSLLLFFVAVLIGVFAIFRVSPSATWLYIGLILASSSVVVYSYCSKCSVRLTSCGHVIPGWLTQFLPVRDQGDYSVTDYLGTAISFVALVGFPQYWLWKDKLFFFVFWTLLIAALIEIRLFVCVACGNEKCPLCKRAD